jgi:predicted transcriptional regulator|tara:strand:- start:56 stop:259 length:204 start_codon:yes stop_codon:yes gene_type:complete
MSDNTQELMKLGNQVARSTVAVVDAVTQRGGFKGEELSTIGTLRDQSIQIISLVEQMQQEAAMEEED